MAYPSPLEPIAPTAQPWLDPECFRPTGEIGCGYWALGEIRPCSPDELVEKIRLDKSERIELVAVPESSRLVPPQCVNFLYGATLERARLAARSGMGLPLVGLILFWGLAIAAAFQLPDAILGLVFLGLFFGGATVFSKVYDLWVLRRSPAQPTPELIAAAKYEAWVRLLAAPADWFLPGLLAVVGLIQIFAGLERSVAAAGLVKQAVWQGEAWRLLTGPLLHGSAQHWWSNAVGLVVFGILLSRLVDRSVINVVFLCSACAGSVLSLLGTEKTSIGASGGVLGLVGFLAVALWTHRRTLPRVALRPVVEVLVFAVLMGVIGYRFIDNWAHLGGLLAGGALGALYARVLPSAFPIRGGRWAAWASRLAATGLAGGAVWAALRMVG
ncbi:MAG TPA: rhomboid family intramembrane serine protease [Anaerolineales bacterium]|nr:rhomboid family intramembrane serine protease [Anaerolineales bacterium]